MFVEEEDEAQEFEIEKILEQEEHQQLSYVGPEVVPELAKQRLYEQNIEIDEANFYEDKDPIEETDRVQVKVNPPPSYQELTADPLIGHPERAARLKVRMELRAEFEANPKAYMQKRNELRDLVQAKAPQ